MHPLQPRNLCDGRLGHSLVCFSKCCLNKPQTMTESGGRKAESKLANGRPLNVEDIKTRMNNALTIIRNVKSPYSGSIHPPLRRGKLVHYFECIHSQPQGHAIFQAFNFSRFYTHLFVFLLGEAWRWTARWHRIRPLTLQEENKWLRKGSGKEARGPQNWRLLHRERTTLKWTDVVQILLFPDNISRSSMVLGSARYTADDRKCARGRPKDGVAYGNKPSSPLTFTQVRFRSGRWMLPALNYQQYFGKWVTMTGVMATRNKLA